MTENETALTVPGQPYAAITDDLHSGLVPALKKVVTFTPTGLELPDDLTFEQAQGITHYIAEIIKRDVLEVNLLQFCLGDIVQYAERRWGDTYSQLLDSTGLAYGTLANTTWVARSIDYSCRREDLSFAHHAVVAPLPPNEQHEWLQRAAENEMGANELRRQIQASKDIKDSKDPAQADIERQLQRVAEKIGDKLDTHVWPGTIMRGLIHPLVFKLNGEDAIVFTEEVSDKSWTIMSSVPPSRPSPG